MGAAGVEARAVGPETSVILEHVPLFAAIEASQRPALYATMHEERFAANQTIFWLGEHGEELYVVITGEVAVTVPNEAGEQITLQHVGPGGFFGEISLLDGGPRTATVRARTPTLCLVLRRDSFHAFLRAHPASSIEILTEMGKRQRKSTAMLRTLKNPNLAFDERHSTRWQRFSDFIAALAGSRGFALFHLVWFGVWVGMNALGSFMANPSRVFHWDPYPFGLLTMVVSLEATFLAIIVMVSQNRQAEKDRIRTDLDHQVNVRAQTEIMQISRRLEEIEAKLQR